MPNNATAPVRDRSKFAELKKKLLALPPAKRVEQEVRLARENGLTITAAEAASIGRPVEHRVSMAATLAPAVTGHVVRVAGDEGGQKLDASSRASLATALKGSPFVHALDPAALNAALKALTPQNAEEVMTRLDPQLELLAASGADAKVLEAAKEAVARTFFSKVVAKAKTPLAGARND